MPIVKCTQCGKEVNRPPSWLKKIKNPFCSSSCAQTYNNKLRDTKMTKKCKECGNLIGSRYTYCSDCIKLGRHKPYGCHIEDRSLRFYVERKSGPTRYMSIRDNAQNKMLKRKKVCKICGYSKHVEVCHIKSISSFLLDTLIGEINDENNLELLCPNCHWEKDNRLL